MAMVGVFTTWELASATDQDLTNQRLEVGEEESHLLITSQHTTVIVFITQLSSS